MVVPLFKSHYSLGKSILTLEKEAVDKKYPDSIFDLCKKAKLKDFFLVDDNMSGFLEAYTNSKELNLKLCFGLRLTACEDMEDKSEDSLSKNNKLIFFAKNADGYRKLIKIYTTAAKKGFYYEPRIDYKNLKELWSEKDLKLCVPFYDSFIHNNFFKNGSCVPALDFTTPTFFFEDNSLPFDELILNKLKKYTKNKNFIQAKSIYYATKKDFKAYLTFRCINKRSSLEKPQLDHMCSDEFCLESWEKQNG